MHSAAPCSATKSPKSRLAPRWIALPYLIDNRYPHSPRLIEYTWQLRHNVTFYDALYVALATALDVPLLTGDSRLAAAPGLPCEIKLVR